MGQHNEPSLDEIRKFIHRVAPGDDLEQDVIFMPQLDKWCREIVLENT